jgi:hypothetical protein
MRAGDDGDDGDDTRDGSIGEVPVPEFCSYTKSRTHKLRVGLIQTDCSFDEKTH